MNTRLWRALAARLEAADDDLKPEEYLAVHRETGASLRAVWNAAQRYFEYGDVFLKTGEPQRADGPKRRAGRAATPVD